MASRKAPFKFLILGGSSAPTQEPRDGSSPANLVSWGNRVKPISVSPSVLFL